MYLRMVALTFVSLLGIFYISSFIDLSDKLFKGRATIGMLFSFFWFSTPQFVYYVIPIALLIATLVTIGLLTRNSELIVMRACGISLYRVAMPLPRLRRAGERAPVRPRGAGAGLRQPAGRPAQPADPDRNRSRPSTS